MTVSTHYSIVTFNLDLLTPKFNAFIAVPQYNTCVSFGKNPTNTFQEIVLTSPETAVSSILYCIMTLTFDLLTPNCEAFISVPQCFIDVSLVKMLKYSARYRVNVLGRTHGRMHRRTGQKQYVSSHTTLGRGLKINSNLWTDTRQPATECRCLTAPQPCFVVPHPYILKMLLGRPER